jgi:PAS domain-containing protein
VSPKSLNEWLAVIGTVSGFLGAAYYFCRRLWKRLSRICELSRQPWEQLFGPDSAQQIHDVIRDLAAAQDVIDVRQSIISRKLRVGIYICDAETGECLYASDYLAEIFGVPPDEMLGLGWAACVVDKEEKVQTWEYCCKRRITYRDNYSVRHGVTGKMVHCRTEAHYVPAGVGRYVGWVEIIIH